MLEGEGEQVKVMDKKNSTRSATSGTPKADTKKLDSGNYNKNGKSGRRREPTVPRSRNDAAAARRPIPQKSGGFDKRPRSRGYGNGRQTEEVIGDYGAEIGSALRPGAKKTNLNHLLNFTYEPRGHSGGGSGRGRGVGKWTGRNHWGGKSARFNKEQFLQANCQFVVKDSRDYMVHAADPDTLVDWDLIEQVRITSHEVPSCPICLYPPIAAKITRCGHIYCWPCILHYLSLGEKSWRKCPICYEAVHQEDLKSVVGLETRTYSVGDVITMKLLRRERGSTHTMPVKQWRPREGKPHNVDDEVDVCYAKLLVANSRQVQSIIDTEKEALRIQKLEDGDTLDGSYVDNALEKLAAREEVLCSVRSVTDRLENLGLGSTESDNEKTSPSASPEEPGADASPPAPLKSIARVVNYVSAFSDEEDEATAEDKDTDAATATGADTDTVVASIASEKLELAPEHVNLDGSGDFFETTADDVEDQHLASLTEIPEEPAYETRKNAGSNQPTTEYYFYQADDGQHIYNHSINSRVLLHEYGSWENCPETITASIVELHSVSMNQDLRRRLRYLSHLPLTCELQLAELNLTPPTVSRESVAAFRDEIEKRKQQRRAKAREEKRVARKSLAEERRQMGLGPGLRVSLESPSHFPQYSEEAFASVPSYTGISQDNESMASSNPSSPRSMAEVLTPFGSPGLHSSGGLNPYAAEFVPIGMSPSQTSLGSDDSQTTGSMSFAQMLQAGKAKPVEAWPKKKSYRDLGPAEQADRRRRMSESEDSESEDRVPVPVFSRSFGSAIQEALDRHSQIKEPVNVAVGAEAVNPAPEVKGKKKKKVKMLLFTTSMARTK